MSKTTVKNEAFIDLEAGLLNQLHPVWERYWMDRSRAIGQAADEQRWGDAHALVEAVDLRQVIGKRDRLLDTLGMASLLLGASRLGRIDRTTVYKAPPKDMLTAATEQVRVLVGDNATTALRHELHLHLDKREYAQSSGNSATEADVFKAQQLQPLSKTLRAAGAKRGSQYLGLAANLHVSRLSSAGFLLEATAGGIKEYQVSELLDSHTCAVCRRMHGMTFPVAQGVQHLAQVFGTTDPIALANLAPWPKQTKAGIAAFNRLDTAGLLDARFHLPPYHPNCRGIIVPVGTVPVLEIDESLAGAVAGITEPDVLGERLFGNRKDLSDTASVLFGAGAVSALYDGRGDDEDPDA